MRIQMADWHKIFGVSALAFNVVIALTGAWLGLQPWLMQWFNISVPNQHVIERVTAPEDDARTTIEWDQIFQSVSQNFPELTPYRSMYRLTVRLSSVFEGMSEDRCMNETPI